MPNSTPPFVHVVGIIDTEEPAGQFLFVTPCKGVPRQEAVGPAPPQGPASGAEMIVEAADGKELARFPVKLMRASDGEDRASAMFDEMVPAKDGMARLRLTYGEQELAVFEAGPEPAPTPTGLSFGMAPPGSIGKRPMSLDAEVAPERGVTYSILVRPSGERLWQTIAMGLPLPKIMLDRNQFPDAERAAVRIVRNTGFSEMVIAEETVELSDPS